MGQFRTVFKTAPETVFKSALHNLNITKPLPVITHNVDDKLTVVKYLITFKCLSKLKNI